MCGGMVKRYGMVGIHSLQDLRVASPHKLRLRLEDYYRSIGMGISVESTDQNYFGMVEGAKRMPTIMDE